MLCFSSNMVVAEDYQRAFSFSYSAADGELSISGGDLRSDDSYVCSGHYRYYWSPVS